MQQGFPSEAGGGVPEQCDRLVVGSRLFRPRLGVQFLSRDRLVWGYRLTSLYSGRLIGEHPCCCVNSSGI